MAKQARQEDDCLEEVDCSASEEVSETSGMTEKRPRTGEEQEEAAPPASKKQFRTSVWADQEDSGQEVDGGTDSTQASETTAAAEATAAQTEPTAQRRLDETGSDEAPQEEADGADAVPPASAQSAESSAAAAATPVSAEPVARCRGHEIGSDEEADGADAAAAAAVSAQAAAAAAGTAARAEPAVRRRWDEIGSDEEDDLWGDAVANAEVASAEPAAHPEVPAAPRSPKSGPRIGAKGCCKGSPKHHRKGAGKAADVVHKRRSRSPSRSKGGKSGKGAKRSRDDKDGKERGPARREEGRGSSTRSAAEAEVNEGTWEHRQEKRDMAVALVKDNALYRLWSRLSSCRRRASTPNTSDRTVSKRKWEEAVRTWKDMQKDDVDRGSELDGGVWR